MSEKISMLLSYLQNASSWISCAELSAVLGVSKRQVRNYISQVNAEKSIIISSPKGYRISGSSTCPACSRITDHETPKQRQKALLYQLIFAQDGLDIFDTAEAFYISVSSLENDLQQMKELISPFLLSIRRKKDLCCLQGTEKNKRRFLRTYYFQNNWDVFVQSCEIPALFAEPFSRLRHDLKKEIHQNNLYINDYSLALFSLYTGILILRIYNGFVITEHTNSVSIPKAYDMTTRHICTYLETNYPICLTKAEYFLLADSLISTSSLWDPSTINVGNLSSYVEKNYIDIAQDIIQSVKTRYPIVHFDESFLVKFTIHLRNCFLRKDLDTYNINLVNNKIKYTYPLVHDASVYIADILEHTYGLAMTQNELAYVAFHLCASLTSHSEYQVTITYVYSDYWEYHRKIIEHLINIIDEKGIIKQAVSVSDYFPAAYHADLIISDTNARFPEPYIRIPSLPASGDYSAIRRMVDTLYQQKQYTFFRENFLHFFDERCFLFYHGQNYLELLEQMCTHAMSLGFVTKEFHADVLKREHLSNTAFYEVAVPHSLSVNALHSFISIAICTPPLSWGNSHRNVKIVLLLGVAENERKTFSHIFDFLVNILSDSNNIRKLAQAEQFSSFLATMDNIAQTVSLD